MPNSAQAWFDWLSQSHVEARAERVQELQHDLPVPELQGAQFMPAPHI